jgi:hypothetical protein
MPPGATWDQWRRPLKPFRCHLFLDHRPAVASGGPPTRGTFFRLSPEPDGNLRSTSVLPIMRYRDTEYQVVQTLNPTGFRWTVHLDENRTKIGAGFSRTQAIGLAQRAIDKALERTVPATEMA